MKLTNTAAAAAVLALLAGAADASALKLKLANPQPSSVKAGLAVNYAYPKDVKSLRDAYVALGIKSETGKPLAGLDYLSSDDEPMALTSTKETKVAADIKGYVRFDTPGIYTLEVYSNDGLDLSIGGQQIAKVDKKRSCDPIGAVEINIREAGWYELEALYWQRKGGSCLIMEWSQNGGELDTVPAELYGH
jgi:hypothetical protein